jgi:uncharacterized membrane protein
MLLVPKTRLQPLDMSVDQALKYIISMGVAAPPNGAYLNGGGNALHPPVLPDNRN